jgi:vacuolar iron transporter family protein
VNGSLPVRSAAAGLATSATLIACLACTGVPLRVVELAGVAGLLAGVLSTGAETCLSVAGQNRLVTIEVPLRILTGFSKAEEEELVSWFCDYGADPDTAVRMAVAVSRDPHRMARLRAREKVGIDLLALPSPFLAGVAAAGAFAVSATIPLLSYWADKPGVMVTLALTALMLGAAGMALGWTKPRPVGHRRTRMPGGTRQMLSPPRIGLSLPRLTDTPSVVPGRAAYQHAPVRYLLDIFTLLPWPGGGTRLGRVHPTPGYSRSNAARREARRGRGDGTVA